MNDTLFDTSSLFDQWARRRDVCGTYWWSGWQPSRPNNGVELAIQVNQWTWGWQVQLFRTSKAYRDRTWRRQISTIHLTRTWTHLQTRQRAEVVAGRLWDAIRARGVECNRPASSDRSPEHEE